MKRLVIPGGWVYYAAATVAAGCLVRGTEGGTHGL